jgi:hypothetical protein
LPGVGTEVARLVRIATARGGGITGASDDGGDIVIRDGASAASAIGAAYASGAA